MFETFEEKGKIYTQVVSKSPIKIVLQTLTNRIYGNMYVRVGDRLKDELDSAVHFMAVTDVEVFDAAGVQLILKTNFMAVNFQHIIWVVPEEEILSDKVAK